MNEHVIGGHLVLLCTKCWLAILHSVQKHRKVSCSLKVAFYDDYDYVYDYDGDYDDGDDDDDYDYDYDGDYDDGDDDYD